MRYRLTPLLNDGMAESPPIEWGPEDEALGMSLMDMIEGEMANDNDRLFGVGFTLLIERIA